MAGGFRPKGLEDIYLTDETRRINQEVRILHSVEVTKRPEEMDVAGYWFRRLHANPRRWSGRVTGNYRITFGWSGENAKDVDFEDYH